MCLERPSWRCVLCVVARELVEKSTRSLKSNEQTAWSRMKLVFVEFHRIASRKIINADKHCQIPTAIP
ncbi:hypothetical protein ANTPLA_LOCUS970 [Anthophora plagiata]